jgi:hypothetical protein
MLYNEADLKEIGATREEVTRAVETLVDSTFKFTLNMNDTFAFACADADDLDSDDFYFMIPIIARHGHHALIAYVAFKRSLESKSEVTPITCKCHHDGKPYHDARKEIEELFNTNSLFMTEIDGTRWDLEHKEWLKSMDSWDEENQRRKPMEVRIPKSPTFFDKIKRLLR